MLEIYAIKDTVIGKFNQPFLMNNETQARRELKIAVNSPNGVDMRNKAGDLQLHRLGRFNDSTGEITSEVEYIETAINLVEKGE